MRAPLLRSRPCCEAATAAQPPPSSSSAARAPLIRALTRGRLVVRSGALGLFYSHASTNVWMLTKFPKGFPKAQRYKKLPLTNTNNYASRGWCFTESSWASMVKGTWFLLDLGRISPNAETWVDMRIQGRYGRRPPITPADFAKELVNKKFTNGKDDHPLCEKLYSSTYTSCFKKTCAAPLTERGTFCHPP